MIVDASARVRTGDLREDGGLVGVLTQLALDADTRDDFERRALLALAGAVPFDRGVWSDAESATAPGDPERLDGSEGLLELPLQRGGRVVGALRLQRLHGSFSPAEVRLLRAIVPTLVLAREASARVGPVPLMELLGPREREIVEYVRLGYTNAQIALATGRSLAAVRNVLVRIFDKTGVRTRAQLVEGPVSTARLTRRERQIVEYLRTGHTNRQIGQLLGISANTVRNTLARLFEKNGVCSRSELMSALAQAPSE